MIKLPVVNRGKSCTGEYGCDNLQNGDTVYVEGYNDAFKATQILINSTASNSLHKLYERKKVK